MKYDNILSPEQRRELKRKMATFNPWAAYEGYKNGKYNRNMTPKEYERERKKIADLLGI